MMKLFKNILGNEKGNVLLLVSLVFTGLLAMTGLVLDGGSFYMTKTHLQKAANAAALSGAQELTSGDQSRVKAIVDDVISFHDELLALQNVDIKLNDRVTVELEKTVPLVFSKLFGIETIKIPVSATAKLGVMGRAQGAAPLGIDRSTPIRYDTEYHLKVGAGDSETGNFGALALGDTGADIFENNLKHGYDNEISINQTINTEAGNMNQPTNRAVNYLINEPCDGPTERDCPRRILVPMYDPIVESNGRIQRIVVVGFTYFYISEPYSSGDSTVRGYFVEYSDTGFEDEGAVNGGAYSIRLTE